MRPTKITLKALTRRALGLALLLSALALTASRADARIDTASLFYPGAMIGEE